MQIEASSQLKSDPIILYIQQPDPYHVCQTLKAQTPIQLIFVDEEY